MELSSWDTFIYLLRIFCGILYFIYKGSKLGLTSKRKPALTRPGSDAPPLSTGFIAKVQFIVEIIPRRTHARRLTITFFYRLTMSCPFDHRTRIRGMYPSSCSLCSARGSEKPDAAGIKDDVTSILEKGPRGRSKRGGEGEREKKVPMRERRKRRTEKEG